MFCSRAFIAIRSLRTSGIVAEESKGAIGSWTAGTPIEISAEMRRLTLSIIGGSLFGPEFRESAAAISAVLARVMKRVGRIAAVLSLLLALYSSGTDSLSDEDIRNEIITFVLAGHETIATALNLGLLPAVTQS